MVVLEGEFFYAPCTLHPEVCVRESVGGVSRESVGAGVCERGWEGVCARAGTTPLWTSLAGVEFPDAPADTVMSVAPA